MINKLLVFFFILFTNASFSQNRAWSIGVLTSPNINTIKTTTEPRDYFYETRGSYNLGLEINHNMTRHTRFSFGIHYSTLKYRSQSLFQNELDSIYPAITNFNTQIIQLPLSYNVNFITKEKYQFYFTFGINSSIALNVDEKTTFGDWSTRNTLYFRPFIMGIQTGLGYSHRISDIFKVKFEPKVIYYRYGFDSITNQRAISWQGFVGLVYLL